jgi:hypothetical protein
LTTPGDAEEADDLPAVVDVQEFLAREPFDASSQIWGARGS